MSRSALSSRSSSIATIGSHIVAQALQPWLAPLVGFVDAPKQRSALLQFLGELDTFAQPSQGDHARHALDTLFPALLFQLQTRISVEEGMMVWLRCTHGSVKQHLAQHQLILHMRVSSYAQRHSLGDAHTLGQIQTCLQQQLLPHITQQDQALARIFLAHPACAEVH